MIQEKIIGVELPHQENVIDQIQDQIHLFLNVIVREIIENVIEVVQGQEKDRIEIKKSINRYNSQELMINYAEYVFQTYFYRIKEIGVDQDPDQSQ